MHKSFADWYRLGAVQPTAEMLGHRWQAAEARFGWMVPDTVKEPLLRAIEDPVPEIKQEPLVHS